MLKDVWHKVALREQVSATAGPVGGGFRKLARFLLAEGSCGFGYSLTATFLVAVARRSRMPPPSRPWPEFASGRGGRGREKRGHPLMHVGRQALGDRWRPRRTRGREGGRCFPSRSRPPGAKHRQSPRWQPKRLPQETAPIPTLLAKPCSNTISYSAERTRASISRASD